MLHWFARRLKEVQEVPRDERGFTLIELLVVVIIIGILAAIAIPLFLNQRERAQQATVQSDVRNAQSSVAVQVTEDGTVPNGTYTAGGAATLPDFTPSEGVTIVVDGTADAYTITGRHDDLGSYEYVYNSSTGEYTETGA